MACGCGDACTYKTPKVGTKGPEDSPIVIVGESPGTMEVVKGLPFVGDSGQLLEQALAKTGLSKLNIEPYYTNAIHCLPRRKEQENLQAACQACHNRLIREIAAHPRKVIIALGAAALWSLLDNYSLKITKERGKVFKTPLASMGIVAAVHPAFLLRGGGNYTQFQNDLNYAVQLLKDPKAFKLPDGTTYSVLETEEEVRDFIHDLELLPPETDIACDIETTGFNYQTDRILCVGFQYKPKYSVIVPEELITPSIWDKATHLNWVWHNGKFDCRFLRNQLYFDHITGKGQSRALNIRVDDDTMLLSYALNERRGIHDLDQVASDWLGSPNHKDMVSEFYKGFVIDPETGQKRRRNLSDAPKDILYRYLASDMSDTYNLVGVMRPQVMEDKNLRRFYTQHLIPGSEFLLKLELNGLLVSDEWVLKNHIRLEQLCLKYEAELNEWGQSVLGRDINPRSWQQVKALLYDGLKLAPNSWSTDDDTLMQLPKHPAVKALQNHRESAKSWGTYVKPLMHGTQRDLIDSKKETVVYPDGRTHSSYLLHGTGTSRLSCKDLNVQNIPREHWLRGQWMAPEGYCIIERDYSQAELRSLAVHSKCEALMDIFLSGKDLHKEFSTYLFGPNFTKEEKMAAKTVNFGIPYGREAPSIASDPQLNAKMEVTIALAQSWIDGWAKRFPGAWKFIEECRLAPLRNQTMVTCFGNKKRPGVVSREKLHDLQNEAANFFHQSTASNITVRAGIELSDRLRDDYDTHLVNTVHDCLVAYTPVYRGLEHIKEVARVMGEVMEAVPQRYPLLRTVPFKTEAEIGWHWGNLVDLNSINTMEELMAIPDYVEPH